VATLVPRSGLLPAERPRKRLIRIQSTTDPKHGKKPEDRTIDEVLAAGVVPLDKPSGPSSHQVAAWLRNALEIDGVGHGGTLDPNVTGVLPVTINGATKVVQALLSSGKEYVAVMRLHEERDEAQVRQVLAADFTGKVQQMPPVRSAVARRTRVRRVYYLDVLEVKGRDVLFRVGCQAGTYVRTLCVDMARALGTRGHMQELRRTRTGLFTEDDLVTLQDCIDARAFAKEGDTSLLQRCVLPVERVTAHLNAIVLRDTAVDAICHGAPLAVIGVAQLDAGIEPGEDVALLTLKGELIALGKAQMTSQKIVHDEKGIAATCDRVVMRPGTYPRVWKKR
jgi:H/ACA ribonucleoprotein complex subunit 4